MAEFDTPPLNSIGMDGIVAERLELPQLYLKFLNSFDPI